MRTESVVESVGKEIKLSADEGAQLLAIGKRLAKGTDRYGQPVENSQASLIDIGWTSSGTAKVRVADAVGLVALPTLRLLVEPKIPQAHLLYLVERSGLLPRLDWQSGDLEQDENLATLISHWFVAALERVLEEGLSRDYRLVSDELRTVRGRLHLLPTARLYYRGKLTVAAEYEEFDFDAPLNRLLRHAARIVAGGKPLPPSLRRRAMGSIRQMEPVGEFRPRDMDAQIDRMTAHYADVIPLAKQVIRSAGRALELGETKSWTFLFRTAGPVEAGIRAVLESDLGGTSVSKRSLPLGGSTRKLHPDLVFGEFDAIGDVKYKLNQRELWGRSDLYEVVAFAAAAMTQEALIINFRSPLSSPLKPVEVGGIRVSEKSWLSDPDSHPSVAASQLCAAVNKWLLSVQGLEMKAAA